MRERLLDYQNKFGMDQVKRKNNLKVGENALKVENIFYSERDLKKMQQ
jgi:hypothetical protein